MRLKYLLLPSIVLQLLSGQVLAQQTQPTTRQAKPERSIGYVIKVDSESIVIRSDRMEPEVTFAVDAQTAVRIGVVVSYGFAGPTIQFERERIRDIRVGRAVIISWTGERRATGIWVQPPGSTSREAE